jgi:hypothetical protein
MLPVIPSVVKSRKVRRQEDEMAYCYLQPRDPAMIPGALLEVRNGMVSHRGIRGRRNPLTGQQPILHSPKNGVVGPTSDWGFAQGRPIISVAVPPNPALGEATVQRMESIQGLPWTLTRANCQHTTNWAAFGQARSDQLEALVGAGILVAALYGLSKQ